MSLDEEIQFYYLSRETLRRWSMTPDIQKQPWLKLSLPLMQTACSCFHHPSHLGACTMKHIGKLIQLENRERDGWMGAET